MIMKKFMVSLMVLFFVVSGSSFALESNFGLGFFVPYFKKPYCNDSQAAYWFPDVIRKVNLNVKKYNEDSKEALVDLIMEQLNAWDHKLDDTYDSVGGLDVIGDQLMSQSYSEIVSDISKLNRLYDRGRLTRYFCEWREAVAWSLGN